MHARTILMAVGVGLLLGGCSPIQPWVKPYEREHFADPIMSFNRDPISTIYLEHVIQVGIRDRIAVERHDGIGEVLALIGFHPGLDRRAPSEEKSHSYRDQSYTGVHVGAHSRTRLRMLSRYSFSSPGL